MLAGHGAVRLARRVGLRAAGAARPLGARRRGRPRAPRRRDARGAARALPASGGWRCSRSSRRASPGPSARRCRPPRASSGVLEGAERRCASRRWRRRLHGARVLSLLGGGETVVPPLLDDPRPEVRAQAAEWASAHRDEAVVQRLVEMLADPRPFTRYTVMDSLIRLGAAASGRSRGRSRAAPARPRSRSPRGSPTRRSPTRPRRARRSRPGRARVGRARARRPSAARRAAELVAGLLEDPEPEVRAAAAVALGRLGHWPVGARARRAAARPGLARAPRRRRSRCARSAGPAG